MTAKQGMLLYILLYTVQHPLPGHWAKMDLQKEQPQNPEMLLGKDERLLKNTGKPNPTYIDLSLFTSMRNWTKKLIEDLKLKVRGPR